MSIQYTRKDTLSKKAVESPLCDFILSRQPKGKNRDSFLWQPPSSKSSAANRGEFLLNLLFICLIFMFMNKSVAAQTDNRGFPIPHPSHSSFGMPINTNPSPSFEHQPVAIPPASHVPIVKHPRHIHRQFYFDYYGYPYYINPTTKNSFFYTIPSQINDDNLVSPNTADLPQGNWVFASEGAVPNTAIVYQLNPVTYYCRAEFEYKTYYGVLVRNEGCLIRDQNIHFRINKYEVLINNN